MSAKGGRELKSPLIDTMNTTFRSKSVISNNALRLNEEEFRENIEIKEAIIRTQEYLKALKPTFKNVGYTIKSSIFYNPSDLLILLSIDGQIFSYSLSSDTLSNSTITTKVEKIFKCLDDEKFLALQSKNLLICDTNTLSAIKTLKSEQFVGSCAYSKYEQLLYTQDSVFILSLKSFTITQTQIKGNGLICIESNGSSHWCVSDKEGLRVFDRELIEVSRISLCEIVKCKFSEKKTQLGVMTENEVQVFGLELSLVNRIHFQHKLTDFIFDGELEFLLVSTSQGELITCDLRLPLRKISRKLHKLPIHSLFIFNSKLVSISQDMRIALTSLHKLKNLYISPFDTFSLAASSQASVYYYLTTDCELKSCNYKESITILLKKFESLSSLLVYHNEKLYVNSISELFEYDLLSHSVKSAQKPNDLFYTSIKFCPGQIICSGASTFIYVYEASDLKFESKFLAHENFVTCLASYQKALVTGSLDKTVRVWDMRSSENMHILSGHTGKITALFVVNGKIFSSSSDRSIKVWYIKTGDCIHTITDITGVIRKFASFNSEFLLTCNHFGILTYWSLKTYSKILTSHLYGPIDKFDANEYYFIYNNRFKSFVFQNPLFVDKILITGPKEYNRYQAHRYLLRLLNGKNPKFDSVCDKWVVFPYILTPLHFYAYYNLPEHISQAIFNNSCLVQSRMDQSPLSIAVSRDLESCVSNIVQLLKPQLEFNPFLLNFITDRSLIEMNFTGHDSLYMFYKALFRLVNSDKLPRFIKSDVKLPVYAKSLGITPKTQAFFPDNKIINSGRAVVYMRSLVKVSLIMGSRSSICLLQSIADCKNPKIFKTRFIKAYIESKWESVKLFMWVQFLIYFSYLFYFCLYLIQIYSNKVFLIIPLFLSLQLTTYEVYKAVVSGKEYLNSAWNYIDAARAIIFLLFFGQQWSDNQDSSIDHHSSIDYVLLFLTIFSFLKGFSYFRLFHHTRHFTQLLTQVILDSYAFSIIIVYNTIAFGFVLLISSTFDEPFIHYLGDSFLTTEALIDTSEYNVTQWIVFVCGIVLNNWVMLSVLISLYSETFDNFIEVAAIENTKVLAAMSLEAERNIFWRRKRNQRSYLQVCTDGKFSEESDPVVDKIKGVKKMVRKGIRRIEKVRVDVLGAIQKNRNKDKKKRMKREEIDKNAWEVLRMLVKGFSGSGVDKEIVEKKIRSIMKIA